MPDTTPRLLVIQADPQQAAIITYRLQLLGYEVQCTHAIQSAWNNATTFLPNAILLDIDGSRYESLDLIEHFSSDVDTADIPIMVMSTDADLDLVEKVWRAGAVSFLVAPFDPEVLEQKVEQMLAHPASVQATDYAAQRPAETTTTIA